MGLVAIAFAAPAWCAEALELSVRQEGQHYAVEVLSDGQCLLRSPADGLWSIATDWDGDWPAGWAHAKATKLERVGAWTILHGRIETAAGTWQLRDSYRPHERTIECIRRFTWKGAETAACTTLSVRFHCPGKGTEALLPGILYYGNPSGARSGRVPVYTGKPGEAALFEEHRFPMPYASIEWSDGSGLKGAALHSLPSPVPFGNLSDQWWSLGMTGKADGTELMLLSGPCASNGKRSVIKAMQGGFVHYSDAYLDVPPGAVIEKTFYLEAYPVAEKGAGFQRPTETSLALAYCPELVARRPDGTLTADRGEKASTRFDAVNRGWVSISRPWHLLTTNAGAGNPHAATAEKGRRLVEVLVERLSGFLVELSEAEVDERFPY